MNPASTSTQHALPNALPLADLHLPDAIGWWPLAPGWWIVGLLLLLLIISLVVISLKHWRRNQDRRDTRQLLQTALSQWQSHRDDAAFINHLNGALKRYCKHRYPQAVSLSGQRWGNFLNRCTPKALFDETQKQQLATGGYQPKPQTQAANSALQPDTAAKLTAQCQRWIQRANRTHTDNTQETD